MLILFVLCTYLARLCTYLARLPVRLSHTKGSISMLTNWVHTPLPLTPAPWVNGGCSFSTIATQCLLQNNPNTYLASCPSAASLATVNCSMSLSILHSLLLFDTAALHLDWAELQIIRLQLSRLQFCSAFIKVCLNSVDTVCLMHLPCAVVHVPWVVVCQAVTNES